MKTWINIFWLGIKELRSVFSDLVMVILIIYSFSLAIYSQATATSESVNNASIAIVDEDHSTLSRAIANALYPPYFKTPELISPAEIDASMDLDRFMFVVQIPPQFEEDVRRGRQPSVQIDIDATAVTQASLGNSYIQNIVVDEVNHFINRSDETTAYPVTLVQRRAFNPNGTGMWFGAINALINQISMITIILTGAALLREREHGTIEHLLVMPLSSFQIVMSKVLANGLIILVAFSLSMLIVVETILDVPISGSRFLLVGGTTIYLFAAAAIGIFLGTIARTMAQFALLMIMVIIPITMLSGGLTPIESQPEIIQPVTWFLPSRHYMSFAQAVIFRGADITIIWPQLLIMIGLGSIFFSASLGLFRRSIAVSR
ncbi:MULTISPECIES: ABC transporter permease [unclassified Neptuniibacter]|jgi:ABC-2 type transport system permease protein|uniref:ABC transporter permease n=1 Tax=unclassified Neptuniibacter TaxID=2630693 RepID=UPI0026E3D147|nr:MULTISPECIES: ABC transporter permease [unclassified Neptuniibacter]MDO6513626.1 ABC transporter permease [Neptuniibacter sp. 2_MG-2023]MDO6593767.1 ABC transporter permease [Neptuniibacter sp. 1_MG-2023]